MKFLLFFAFLALALGKHVNFRNDLTYDDLLQTNVTCAFSQVCNEAAGNPLEDRTCGCDNNCNMLGTCCIDSPYRDRSAQMMECRNVGQDFSKRGHFLVSKCPPQVGSDSVWKDLCEKEWKGEDDMMMLAPVTSLEGFDSYKNYYCFRCHEDRDQFLSWDLQILGNVADQDEVRDKDFSVTYDKEKGSWTATTGDGYVLDGINFNFLAPAIPGVTGELTETCHFILVSDCDASWKDEDTREKCRSYTAIVHRKHNDSVTFRNPHCALCNFEQVENLYCGFVGIMGARPEVFSFAHLLNIHREDENRSRTRKCEENQLWDPYGKRCRRIACAIPGYVVKEGRCTPP